LQCHRCPHTAERSVKRGADAIWHRLIDNLAEPEYSSGYETCFAP
jgi:hypothetical protein